MKRLINADELKSDILSKMYLAQKEYLHKSHIVHQIDVAPTVDAVEVVHGRWNRKQIGKYTGTDEVVCSCCGYFLAVVGTDIGFKEAIKDMNYCPNCGAKMDGKE